MCKQVKKITKWRLESRYSRHSNSCIIYITRITSIGVEATALPKLAMKLDLNNGKNVVKPRV